MAKVEASIEGRGFKVSSCVLAVIWAFIMLINSARSVLPSLSNLALMASYVCLPICDFRSGRPAAATACSFMKVS